MVEVVEGGEWNMNYGVEVSSEVETIKNDQLQEIILEYCIIILYFWIVDQGDASVEGETRQRVVRIRVRL